MSEATGQDVPVYDEPWDADAEPAKRPKHEGGFYGLMPRPSDYEPRSWTVACRCGWAFDSTSRPACEIRYAEHRSVK